MPHDVDLTDRELVRRARLGDVAAFEVLFRRFHMPLCEFVDGFVHSQAVAEEIVQDLFFAVWKGRAQWKVLISPRAYLFGAARNRAIHFLRNRAVAERWREQAQRGATASFAANQPATPDEVFEATQSAAVIRSVIDALPERARVAFTLQQDRDMSNAEIAAAMAVSLETVEKHLATARERLRASLPAEVGIAAGAALPRGDFDRFTNAGYHVGVLLNVHAPVPPLSFRFEGSFSQFDYDRALFNRDAQARIISGTANAVLSAPGMSALYIIGGLGVYHASAECSGCTTSSTKGGVNIGAGYRIGLAGFSAFVEARYHFIPGPNDPTNGGSSGSNTQFLPLTFGVIF